MNHNLEDVTISLIKNGNKEQDDKLLQPYAYISQVPGKKIRETLVKAFNYWLEIPEHIITETVEIITMLQNSTLMIDDIQDDSMVRRGIPTAHVIYGIPTTLNSASYLMFIALQKGWDIIRQHECITWDLELLLDAFRGQGMDIYWRENCICPTEEEYCLMATQKTANFFIAIIRNMQIYSENKYDFSNLTSTLGLYFQIHDDYLNLFSPDFQKFKGFCEDITEGKFSFPLIHAINSDPNGEVLEILKKRTTDVELKKHCIFLLNKYGSFDYTRNKLNCLQEQLRNEIDKLGGNPYIDDILNQIFMA